MLQIALFWFLSYSPLYLTLSSFKMLLIAESSKQKVTLEIAQLWNNWALFKIYIYEKTHGAFI